MPGNTPISEIMTRDVVTVEVSAPMSEVRTLLTTGKFHHLPVVEGDQLVGIVSTNDLIRVTHKISAANLDDLNDTLDRTTSLKKIMQSDLSTLRPNETAECAIDLLATGERHSILVVDRDDALVGIITNIDILEYLFA